MILNPFEEGVEDYILGVDPGGSGGACLLNIHTKEIEELHTFKTFEGAANFMQEGSIHKRCFLEKVHSMPQQGVASTFKFGTNFGLWQGLILGLGYELELVPPQVWQSDLNLPKSRSKTDHKNNLKQKAAEFWPDTKWTHATADAALIARYGLNLISSSEDIT